MCRHPDYDKQRQCAEEDNLSESLSHEETYTADVTADLVFRPSSSSSAAATTASLQLADDSGTVTVYTLDDEATERLDAVRRQNPDQRIHTRLRRSTSKM